MEVSTEALLSDDKLPFFVSEKQLEEQDARTPLLCTEDNQYLNEGHFEESDLHEQGYQPLQDYKLDESVVVYVA